MTQGGAVEAAATLVYNAAFVHFEDHRGRDCVSERCDVWKVALDRYADAVLQAAQEEAEAKVARLQEALRNVQKVGHSYKVNCGCAGCASNLTIANAALSDEGHTEAP